MFARSDAIRADIPGTRKPVSSAEPFWSGRSGDYAIAFGAACVVALIFWVASPAEGHWFLVPIVLCGGLAGADVGAWLRGKLDLFDPRTIIGCVALYGFFLAPILNVYWDTFGAGDLPFWGDWRPWLGAMASLNVLGLSLYHAALNFTFAHTKPSSTEWEIDQRNPYPFFAGGLLVALAGVTTFLWQMNGISGVVRAFEGAPEAFVGKGWLLILAWPTAVLLFIIVAYTLSNGRSRAATYGTLLFAVVLLVMAGAAHFLFVGAYGSRGTTIWALFWMLGIVHYRLRKLPNSVMILAVIFLICFMYVYGFYKEKKSAAFELLRTPSGLLDPEGYQRNIKFLLLGDLARADSDAFILRNITSDSADYDYRWGLTYAGGFVILVPKTLWPERPEVRIDAGSEALWGKATELKSSRMYGLGGEAMLNFGPWGVAPIFALLGGVVGFYRRKLLSWDRADARLFLAPFLTSLTIRPLAYDSDVLLFSLLTEGSLIIFILLLASKRVPRGTERSPQT